MTKRNTALVLLCSTILVACTLDSLWGVDSPRPALQQHDIFAIDPLCRDLIVDTEALAVVPVVVTMTGKRRDSGLGAEGVPVAVSRGACDGTGFTADASVLAAEVPEGTGVEGGKAARKCMRSARPLADNLSDRVMLRERPNEGCRLRSASRLDCTLNARGEASFEVISNLTEDEVTDLGAGPGYVPLCLRPLEFGHMSEEVDGSTRTNIRYHSQELWVLPRAGRTSTALATIVQEVQAPDVLSDVDSRACDTLYDCVTPRERATLLAGFASREIPQDTLRREDLLPATQTVDVRAVLSVVRKPDADAAIYLSSGDCRGPTGPLALDMQIAQSEASTLPFYVCGPGHEAEYSVVTRLLSADDAPADAGADAAVDGGVEPADEAESPDVVVHAASVTAISQAKGFVVVSSGEAAAVQTLTCDGMSSATPAQGPLFVRPPLASNSAGEIVVTCDDDDGGAPRCDMRSLPIELRDGTTCNLEVPPL